MAAPGFLPERLLNLGHKLIGSVLVVASFGGLAFVSHAFYDFVEHKKRLIETGQLTAPGAAAPGSAAAPVAATAAGAPAASSGPELK